MQIRAFLLLASEERSSLNADGGAAGGGAIISFWVNTRSDERLSNVLMRLQKSKYTHFTEPDPIDLVNRHYYHTGAYRVQALLPYRRISQPGTITV